MAADQPTTAAGRGSIAYEPCPQDGHSHDWRDCPTPEDWATTTAATDDDKPTAEYGALARASALAAGDSQWFYVVRWVPGQPQEARYVYP